MQKNMKNEVTNKRTAAHVPCIKIETKKCKNGFRKDIQSATNRQILTYPFLQNFVRWPPFCPVTPIFDFQMPYKVFLHEKRRKTNQSSRTSLICYYSSYWWRGNQIVYKHLFYMIDDEDFHRLYPILYNNRIAMSVSTFLSFYLSLYACLCSFRKTKNTCLEAPIDGKVISYEPTCTHKQCDRIGEIITVPTLYPYIRVCTHSEWIC